VAGELDLTVPEPVTVRTATEQDVPAAARVLAAAFADYPWTRWTVPADDHVGRLERLQALTLGHVAVPYGVVHVAEAGGAVVGAAAWLRADMAAPPHVWAQVTREDAVLLGDRAEAAGTAEAACEPLRPPAPYALLATIGVDPAAQGAGVGAALVAAGLAAVGDDAPAYLETSSERNVAFYRRCGFAVTGRVDVPGGGPPVWGMLRG
jgi:ribosomal protein S18 acetylase RimI-like enzyme